MIIVSHGRDITHVCIADLGFLVPPEHGVDSFGELSTATLVDAAGIHPLIIISGQHISTSKKNIKLAYGEFKSVLSSLATEPGYLLIALH
jgi:hypothetical protein